jgi:hypothetical protein
MNQVIPPDSEVVAELKANGVKPEDACLIYKMYCFEESCKGDYTKCVKRNKTK